MMSKCSDNSVRETVLNGRREFFLDPMIADKVTWFSWTFCMDSLCGTWCSVHHACSASLMRSS